jgi:hypothetical protein
MTITKIKLTQDITNQATEWVLPVNLPTAPVIETHALSKTYKGVQALNPLDLQVQQNTTIKLLLGLSRPTGGSGKVFGKDIVNENDKIRCRVGYLSQDPPPCTANSETSFTRSPRLSSIPSI